MNDEVLGPVDDDSPWRPDADVEFDRVGARDFAPSEPMLVEASPTAPTVPVGAVRPEHPRPEDVVVAISPARGRGGWIVSVAVAIVMVAAIGFVVISDETPTGGFAAPVRSVETSNPDTADAVAGLIAVAPSCEQLRLPTSQTPRWSSEFPGADDVVGDVIAGRDNVAATTVDADGTQRLRLLDADDGTERWQLVTPPGAQLVGVSDDVVLTSSSGAPELSVSPTVTAHSAIDGSVVWTRLLSPQATFEFDSLSESLVVDDPEAGPDDIGFTSIIDVASGMIEVSNVGRLVSLDENRRAVTLAGDKVLATSEDPSAGGLIGARLPGAPFAVLGSTVVSAPDKKGLLAVSRQEAGRGGVTDLVALVPPVGFDGLGVVTSLNAVSETAVVLTTNGFVVGAELVGGRFEGRWAARGALLASAPSERGRTLLVADDGGATQSLIDAASGTEFIAALAVRGGIDAGDMYSNGVLVRGATGAGPTLVAYDLDGEPMWSRIGGGRLGVGVGAAYSLFRQVGTATEPPSVALGLVAFGDAGTVPNPCDASSLGGAGTTR